MNKIGTLLFAIFIASSLFANGPQFLKGTLNWSEERALVPAEDAGTYFISHFEGAFYDETNPTLPYVTERFLLSDYSDIKAVFFNTVYEPYTKTASVDDVLLSENINIKITVEKDRSDYYGRIAFVPIRKTGADRFERLVSYEIRLSYTTIAAPISLRNGNIHTSVLSDGDIYKFAVSETGVYKLDYNFLKNEMGIDVDNIDPRTLKLYGNGGGVLPELVEAERPDDLVENAIKVIGEEDGNFNDGDYILFYGQGPNIWKYNYEKQVFDFPMNYYDTKNYYFIKINNGNGLRVANQPSINGSIYESNSFNDFIRYEKDIFNVMHDWSFGQGSGRNFFGDYFKVKIDEDYSDEFQVENLITNASANLKSIFCREGGRQRPYFFNYCKWQ